MTAETPKVTAAFIAVSIKAHHISHITYIFPKTVALLTCTSEAFWEELCKSGKGPQLVHYNELDWFLLADVQDWFVANVCGTSEAGHD